MYRWFVAYRYVLSRLIVLFGLLIVAEAVAVLIVVVSVMEGFRTELEKRIRGTTSDIKVESTLFLGLEDPERVMGLLETVPGVARTAAVIETFALYSVGGVNSAVDQEAEDRFVIALDFENELIAEDLNPTLAAVPTVPKVPPYLELQERHLRLARGLFGTQPRDLHGVFSREWIEVGLWKPWLEVNPQKLRPIELPPVLVGVESFRRELLLPGNVIQLTSISPTNPEPHTESFLVVGFFKTGLYDIDAKGVLMPIGPATRFLRLGGGAVTSGGRTLPDRVSGIRVAVEDGYQNEESLRDLRVRIETTLDANDILFVKTQTWREARAQLLSAVKVEKVIVSITLGALILFAGFMIFIILTVQVVEKSRDIAILQSLGSTTSGIAFVYFAIGSSLCVLGMILGTIYGVAFGLGINTVQRWIKLLTGYEVFPDDIYYLDHIPVKFQLGDIAFIVVTTVLASLLASVVPAIRAARRDPVDGLRKAS